MIFKVKHKSWNEQLWCNCRELVLITDYVLCRREHVQRRPVRRPPEHLLPQQQRGLREYCFLYMQMWHFINCNQIVFGNHNFEGIKPCVDVLSGNKKNVYRIDWSYALRSFRFVKKITILYMICKKCKKIDGTVLHGTVAGVTTLGFAGEVTCSTLKELTALLACLLREGILPSEKRKTGQSKAYRRADRKVRGFSTSNVQ